MLTEMDDEDDPIVGKVCVVVLAGDKIGCL